MAILEVDGRNAFIQVKATTFSGPNGTTISGVRMWGWKEDLTEDDTTTMDDGGYKSSLVLERGVTVAFEGKKQLDMATGDRDAGQGLVEDSWNDFGVNRLLYYRIAWVKDYPTDLSELGSVVFQGSAKPSDMGGETGKTMDWKVEVNVYGRPLVASGCLQYLR